jgi:hypothetical protein
VVVATAGSGAPPLHFAAGVVVATAGSRPIPTRLEEQNGVLFPKTLFEWRADAAPRPGNIAPTSVLRIFA